MRCTLIRVAASILEYLCPGLITITAQNGTSTCSHWFLSLLNCSKDSKGVVPWAWTSKSSFDSSADSCLLMFLDIPELQCTRRMASKCGAVQCSKAILNNHPAPMRKREERELLVQPSPVCVKLWLKNLDFASSKSLVQHFHIFPQLIPAPCPLLQSLRQSLRDSAGPGAQRESNIPMSPCCFAEQPPQPPLLGRWQLQDAKPQVQLHFQTWNPKWPAWTFRERNSNSLIHLRLVMAMRV